MRIQGFRSSALAEHHRISYVRHPKKGIFGVFEVPDITNPDISNLKYGMDSGSAFPTS
jgi:hypothetical protein